MENSIMQFIVFPKWNNPAYLIIPIISIFELFCNVSCSEYKFDENALTAGVYAYVLDSLASASKVLDSDIESLRAYSEAKKQIDTAIVLLDKSDYLGGYSRIWSASSYITYGISYTKTIKNDFSLKELGSNIIDPISSGLNTDDLLCIIDEQEEKAIIAVPSQNSCTTRYLFQKIS